jgi:hypothetical protein
VGRTAVEDFAHHLTRAERSPLTIKNYRSSTSSSYADFQPEFVGIKCSQAVTNGYFSTPGMGADLASAWDNPNALAADLSAQCGAGRQSGPKFPRQWLRGGDRELCQ